MLHLYVVISQLKVAYVAVCSNITLGTRVLKLNDCNLTCAIR